MLPRLGSKAYHALVRLAALLGQPKARKWVAGRTEIAEQLATINNKRKAQQSLIWMHAASLGEFEQGAPVFAALKAECPEAYFVLTFFSPSGYEARKNYPLADTVLYLPPDNAKAAKEWVGKLRPSLAIFVKYEFWPYHLQALAEAEVPTALIAGSFRAQQPFFKWYGAGWRTMLGYFQRIIVQTPEDMVLLAILDVDAVLGGDPRADRVLQLAEESFYDPVLASFAKDHKILLAGSVWSPDVELLAKLVTEMPDDWRLILAPHQLKESELQAWSTSLNAVRYSNWDAATESERSAKVLIMDTIGILSKAYRYARLAYVGGGFGNGIHNTLEPMAYGLPVIFGPKYQKFPEAVLTVKRGGSFCVNDAQELQSVFKHLSMAEGFELASANIAAYTENARGATRRTLAALPKF